MRVNIRFAGLNDQSQQRLRVAVNALGLHQMQGNLADWDGTRCDLLVVDAADGYGLHAIEIATRRRVPVVAFGDPGAHGGQELIWVPQDAPLVVLVNAMFNLLERKTPQASAEPVEANNAARQQAGLFLLASDHDLKEKDLEARQGNVKITLSASRGRAFATNLQQLMLAATSLCESGWEFTPTRPCRESAAASMSLDAFYVRGAATRGNQLPQFPSGQYFLSDWPDLGSTPDLVDALKITPLLMTSGGTPEKIAQSCSLGMEDVSAYLWAFQAAGLITRSDDTSEISVESSPGKPVHGIIAKIAARFGLT